MYKVSHVRADDLYIAIKESLHARREFCVVQRYANQQVFQVFDGLFGVHKEIAKD